jgi:hypothetical protein
VKVAVKPCATGPIPMAPVQDVQRSAVFYRLFGTEVRGSVRNSFGMLPWVAPVFERLNRRLNVPALRNHLFANGVNVSSMADMPKNEVRVEDPDGYMLLLGQNG